MRSKLKYLYFKKPGLEFTGTDIGLGETEEQTAQRLQQEELAKETAQRVKEAEQDPKYQAELEAAKAALEEQAAAQVTEDEAAAAGVREAIKSPGAKSAEELAALDAEYAPKFMGAAKAGQATEVFNLAADYAAEGGDLDSRALENTMGPAISEGSLDNIPEILKPAIQELINQRAAKKAAEEEARAAAAAKPKKRAWQFWKK